MKTVRILALLPVLALSAPVLAQDSPTDEGVVILFGVEGLPDPVPVPDPDPAPDPAAPGDGAVDFGGPQAFDLPQIAAPEALSPPSGAQPAPGAAVETVAIPEDWVEHSEYGLSFALPPGFVEIERDEDDAEILLMMGTLDMQARRGVAYTIGFVPPRDAASMPEEVGQQFGIGALQPAPEPLVLAGLRWTEYQAQTDSADLGGVTASVAMRVLMAQEPNAYGMTPVLMMIYFSEDRAAHLDTEHVFLGSIRITGTLGAPTPESLRDGAVSYQVPPGGRMSGGLSPTERWVIFDESRVDYARVVVAELGTADWAGRSFLRSEFNGPVLVEDGVFDGVPVWILTGRPAFDLSANRTREGDAWRARAVVTQLCPTVQGPIALTAITTTDRIEAGLSLEGLLAPARLHLEGAPPCPEAIVSAFAAAMGQADVPAVAADPAPAPNAPSDGVGATPDPVPPAMPEPGPQPQEPPSGTTPQTGKPDIPAAATPPAPTSPDPATVPTPPVNPDDAAWARADAAQTPAAMLAYLADWPNGAYAERARAWLSARAIAVPQDAPRDDPEARAWAQAEAAQSVEAMLRYLRDWPRGAHAGTARDWLLARAIIIPDAGPPPAAVPGK